MNIVVISSMRRSELLEQTLHSLSVNATKPHHITIVVDGFGHDSDMGVDCYQLDNVLMLVDSLIVNRKVQGASASRNIGASSIPTYRRQKYVMFSDDDCYYVKGWDEKIEAALEAFQSTAVVSGHAHPFNHPIGKYQSSKSGIVVDASLVLSTVNIAMPWVIWDKVGWWIEPGGPGGSEDVEWCKRAVDKNIGLAVTVPQCVIHTGLTSSRGEPIVGADMVRERNRELEIVHGVVGKVRYE